MNKSNKKEQHEHEKIFLGAALATPTAQRLARNQYGYHKYQATWERNGQKVKLRGFKGDEMGPVVHALNRVETHTQSRTPMSLKSISNKRMGLRNRNTLGGAYRPITRNLVVNKRAIQRKSSLPLRVLRYGEERMDGGAYDPGKGRAATRGESWKRAGKRSGFSLAPDAIIRHEIGHSIDRSNKKSSHSTGGFAKSAGWQKKAPRKFRMLKKQIGTNFVRRKGYKGGKYQSINPKEDFAETYAKMTTEKGVKHSDAVVGHGRAKYMYSHVINPNPHPVHAKVYLHNHEHLGKFVLGGVAAGAVIGGGAYGYHKYHTDAKFKRRVDQRVHGARTKLHV